jgi:hypothetical protein
VFVAVGLTFAWMGMWAAYIFAGQLTPVEPEAFKLVPSLDITIMVRALAFGGVLLWRRDAWGYIVAANAGGDHHRRDSPVGGKRAGRVGTADLTAPRSTNGTSGRELSQSEEPRLQKKLHIRLANE